MFHSLLTLNQIIVNRLFVLRIISWSFNYLLMVIIIDCLKKEKKKKKILALNNPRRADMPLKTSRLNFYTTRDNSSSPFSNLD